MGIDATIDSKKYNGIEKIEVGGKSINLEQTFTGTKSITANGTYDVKGYASAEVNVQTEGESFTLQEKTVTQNGEVTPDNGYDGLSKVTVNVPSGGVDYVEQRMLGNTYEYENSNITVVKDNALKGDEKITKCVLPNCTEVKSSAFYGCSLLESVYIPNLKSLGQSALQNCYVLTEAIFPNLEGKLLNSIFTNDKLLKKVDLGKISQISNDIFYQCSVLDIIILRYSTNVCKLYNTKFLQLTPFAEGKGYIFVPSALVDAYKTATGWSQFADHFKALEDYTVDGTITGALDETKLAELGV